MYIGFYNHHKEYNVNRMFSNDSSVIGDNMMSPFVALKEYLEKKGHRVATIDTDALSKFDAIVFIEFPGLKNKYFKKLIKNRFKNLSLMVSESPIIKPDNLDVKNHKYFKKVFTWDDNIIDNKKYFKLNYMFRRLGNIDFSRDKKEKLCCMIAGNKLSKHKKELYTERIKAIRWFEKKHPDEFDLYGFGWDKYHFHGKFLGFNMLRLNRLKFLAKILGTKYPSWRGGVKSKNKTFKKYKFAICYENANGFNGYITEKIFDCFFAGCVPIYLGAANISRHIPKETFIDKRDFSTYEELYFYLKSLPNEKYQTYIRAIKNFLLGEEFYQFSIQSLIDIFEKEVL